MSRTHRSPRGGTARVVGVAVFALATSCGLLPLRSDAATLILAPVADAALYEETATATANGAGEVLIAGRNNQASNSRRRSLLRFDLTGLPEGATISSVSLRLFLLAVTTADTTLALHRVTTPWTEGPANPTGNESTGIAAVVGDSTWRHARFDSAAWIAAGGDAIETPSATLTVGATSGDYTWTSAGLVGDAVAWAADPSQNFGWLLRSDELVPQTAKRFASSENPDPELRPTLVIGYNLIPEPTMSSLMGFGLSFLLSWRRRGRSASDI